MHMYRMNTWVALLSLMEGAGPCAQGREVGISYTWRSHAHLVGEKPCWIETKGLFQGVTTYSYVDL